MIPMAALHSSLMLLEKVDHRQGSDTAQRTLFMREMSKRDVGGDIKLAARNHRGEGDDAGAETLAEVKDIRVNAIMLKSKHPARTANGDGDLVEDEQDAMSPVRSPSG